MRFLYDTAIFVYAVGSGHPLREPCREVVRRAGAGELRGEASADLLQEYAHQRMRRTGDRSEALVTARAIVPLCRWHDVTLADAELGLELCGRHPRLRARDGTFAAVALRRSIPAILTPDTDFDGIDGLQRVDPGDPGSLAALAR